MYRFVYHSERTLSYGYWECANCGFQTDDPVRLYEMGCMNDKSKLTYHFGPKEVEAVKNLHKHGEDDNRPATLGMLTYTILSQRFPELLS